MVAKKNVFDWNHISDKLSTDEVDEGLTKDSNCSNSLVIHSLS